MKMVKTVIREGREGHEENHRRVMRRFFVTPVFAFLRVSSRPSRIKKGVE
ncbi:MAG: hypothetical protein K8F26_12580 [Thiobacillus sp.]|nr:hypothetical protein [Thiobacillus sp.]